MEPVLAAGLVESQAQDRLQSGASLFATKDGKVLSGFQDLHVYLPLRKVSPYPLRTHAYDVLSAASRR